MEEPLLRVNLNTNRFNRHLFFNPNAHHGGGTLVDSAYIALNPQQQADFRALYWANNDTNLDRVDMNCFDFDNNNVNATGLATAGTIVAVFKDISRVNHSCRPNANMDWDTGLGANGAGTLHAMHDIDAGEEITISYNATPMDSFKTAARRRNELQQNFGFVCNCAACRSRLVADDRRREELLQLHGRILWHEGPRIGRRWQSHVDFNSLQMAHLSRYSKLLEQVGLTDDKQSRAYVTGVYHVLLQSPNCCLLWLPGGVIWRGTTNTVAKCC